MLATPKALGEAPGQHLHVSLVELKVRSMGLDPVGGKPQDAEQFLRKQIERFGAAVASVDVKPDN